MDMNTTNELITEAFCKIIMEEAGISTETENNASTRAKKDILLLADEAKKKLIDILDNASKFKSADEIIDRFDKELPQSFWSKFSAIKKLVPEFAEKVDKIVEMSKMPETRREETQTVIHHTGRKRLIQQLFAKRKEKEQELVNWAKDVKKAVKESIDEFLKTEEGTNMQADFDTAWFFYHKNEQILRWKFKKALTDFHKMVSDRIAAWYAAFDDATLERTVNEVPSEEEYETIRQMTIDNDSYAKEFSDTFANLYKGAYADAVNTFETKLKEEFDTAMKRSAPLRAFISNMIQGVKDSIKDKVAELDFRPDPEIWTPHSADENGPSRYTLNPMDETDVDEEKYTVTAAKPPYQLKDENGKPVWKTVDYLKIVVNKLKTLISALDDMIKMISDSSPEIQINPSETMATVVRNHPYLKNRFNQA